MRAYLVRDSERTLLGIFFAERINGYPSLCSLIDERTDPSECEYTVLPSGGLFWDGGYLEECNAQEIPFTGDPNDPDDVRNLDFADCSLSEDWFHAFRANLRWHRICPKDAELAA